MFSSKDKKDKKKYSGFPGDCSQEQLQALGKFRVALDSKGCTDSRWDDTYLLRFLRARKFVLKDTQKMWWDFIQWRQKNQVDQLQRFYFPQMAAIRKLYPHGYHKFDRKYRPIYIERVGFIQPQEIFKITTENKLLNYYAMSYEALLDKIFSACSEQRLKETGQDGKVMQTCTILDLKDVKLSNASAAYKFVKPASEMAQNNYPQILGNMFIINAPFLFTGIWAIVKMWIDEKTKEKIKILGSGYKKELLQYIDPANLPDFIDGGTCKCPGGDCLSLNIGPWNPEGAEFFPNCFKKVEEKKVEEKKVEEKKVVEEKKELQNSEQKKIEKKEDVPATEKVEQVKNEEKPSKQQQKIAEDVSSLQINK